MTATDAHPAGRRERKKQRTREALIDAAFRLFAEKGFDATTVEEIADAVDVSSRTFFRYFASKEDVALTFQEEQHTALLEAFAGRPADEPIMTAVRRSVVGVARACENGEMGFDPERFHCMMTLRSESPALLGGSLEHTQKKQRIVIQAIADRMGADPETDLRPHVVATTIMAAIHAASDVIINPRMPYTSLTEAVDAVFAILEESMNIPSDGAAE
jgi:AcrR family transcriptional regulator